MTKKLKSIDIKDIIIFLIPIIVFGISLYIFFPGILSYDSYTQLHQIKTRAFYNWHPFIHTFIEMICLKVWKSPASVGIFQILLFSTIWSIICKYNRVTNSLKEHLLQILVTLIIVINPINCIHSITLWKDIIFSYNMLLLCFLVQVIINKKYLINNKLIVFLAFIAAVTSKIRFNGIFSIIILISILSILFYKNSKKNYIKLPLLFISFLLCLSGLDAIYHVTDDAKSAVNTKIMHMIGYYETKDFLTEEDNKVISKIIDIDILKESYNDYFADTIYAYTNGEEATKNRNRLIIILAKNTLKHPLSSLKYLLKSSTIVWSVTKPDDMIGTILWLRIEAPNNEDNIKAINEDKDFYKTIISHLENSTNQKLSYALLYSPATYMYLTIIIIGLIIFWSKKLNILLILLSNFINTTIVGLSLPIQDIRYLYPNMLLFYYSLIILINIVFTKKRGKKYE